MSSNLSGRSAPADLPRFRVNPKAFDEARQLFNRLRINTVCEGAKCPNRAECYSRGTATVMILGDVCTRNCRFCCVPHGRPGEIDPDEPERVLRLVELLKMRHVVITSVTRDDLADGGASEFFSVAEKIASCDNPPVMEALAPDFAGNMEAVQILADSAFHVLGHNIETVPRLYGKVRPGANYAASLSVLGEFKRRAHSKQVKSGIMLGLGETDDEVKGALYDLRRVGVDIVAMGQYLRPSSRQLPVSKNLSSNDFDAWKTWAETLGFKKVYSDRNVRTSYAAYT